WAWISSRPTCDGLRPSCVEAFALIGLKLPPVSNRVTALAQHSIPNASRRVLLRSAIRLPMFQMIRAWLPVVAALITWAPGSSSQHRQYRRIAAASVDFAFLRATANSAEVNRR